jgi:hypothetical protein
MCIRFRETTSLSCLVDRQSIVNNAAATRPTTSVSGSRFPGVNGYKGRTKDFTTSFDAKSFVRPVSLG